MYSARTRIVLDELSRSQHGEAAFVTDQRRGTALQTGEYIIGTAIDIENAR